MQVKRALKRAQRVKPQGLGDREHYALKPKKQSKARNRRFEVASFDYMCVVCARDLIYVIPSGFLESKTQPGMLILEVLIKPETESTRKDSQAATNRWLPFKNAVPEK